MIDAVPVDAGKEKIDEFSDTWIFIEHWLKEDLAESHKRNESLKRTDVETAALRGRIALINQLLELPLPPKRDRQRVHRPPGEPIEY